jgi:hypothetical protein
MQQCMLLRQHTILGREIDLYNVQFRNFESKLFCSCIGENCREHFTSEAKSWKSQI